MPVLEETDLPATTVLLIAVMISFSFVSTLSYGEQPAEVSQRESLRGLVGVEVLVEPFAIEIEELGLHTPRLYHEIKQRLQKAGISVLTERERLATPAAAMLSVRVDALHDRIGRYFYSTELFLSQRVRLEGNEVSELFAATWRKPGAIGVVADDNIKHLEKQMIHKVDEFIKDYLVANPDKSKNDRRLRKP